ncbi:nitroreductase family protein [Bacteroides sp.]|uniref:nitroreductase family protein n=1 Tax=Bacteroides sp. TaxID=29523 RepID=UPI00262DA6AE|nr:nitroreductase family protein [Bacteroides sp.]MDD3037737.1 nitroreductase family protein [Bacteroides sp.]
MKINEVIENIKARRSVRTFTDQQVSEEDLLAILEAATYAPNGMHYESWHFTAIRNCDKLIELNNRIKGAFAKSDDLHLQERAHNPNYCCYYHAPTLVIVSNEPTQWWAGMDCACAIENMFLASTSLGIGSCWINQLGTTCDDPEVREFITFLGVPENHKVYGCVALGFANPKTLIKTKAVKVGTVTIVK